MCGSSCTGTSSVALSVCSAGSCQAQPTKTCAGNLVCSAAACKTLCSADADCVSGYFCDGGTCHLAAKAISAGDTHTCALLTDGTVWCWGDNSAGELGNGQITVQDSNGYAGISPPVQVQGLPSKATAIGCGSLFSCALLDDGTIWCWGSDGYGQLGDGLILSGTNTAVATPQKVGINYPATSIAVGYFHACALVDNGAWCWGNGAYGQLGDMLYTSQPQANATPQDNFAPVTAVWAGFWNTCAVSQGTLYCWGANDFGQIGDGSTDSSVLGIATPQKVLLTNPPTISKVTISAGNGCVLFANGSVDCWGSTPAALSGLPSMTGLCAGQGHFCGVDNTGGVWCWYGSNMEGELGDGTTVPPSGPVSVVGLPGPAASVSAGEQHSCALLKDGAVWCWGANYNGQIAPAGAGYDFPTPVQIAGW